MCIITLTQYSSNELEGLPAAGYQAIEQLAPPLGRPINRASQSASSLFMLALLVSRDQRPFYKNETILDNPTYIIGATNDFDGFPRPGVTVRPMTTRLQISTISVLCYIGPGFKSLSVGKS